MTADPERANFPTIYFAGVTTNPLCDAFAGLHVLESFANVPKLMDRHRPLFRSMCLDSGAYSVMTTGQEIDLVEYTDFCLQHGRFYDFVASLDSIMGGVEANLKNWAYMLERGVQAVPTYHSGEPYSVLEDYCSQSPMVGIGVQRPNGKMPAPSEMRRYLDEVFKHIPAGHRVHGWGMTNYTDYPFTSVDSTTWMWEYKALLAVKGQGAEAMGCLTPGELIGIVQKKYERLARRRRWSGEREEEAA